MIELDTTNPMLMVARLYQIAEEFENDGRIEDAHYLHWAIFQIETHVLGIKL